MFAYYTACDFAFIGGSLLPLGGQNLIEACACGKPVLLGPHMFNFAQPSDDALAAGAALQVADAREVFARTFDLLANSKQLDQMSAAAVGFAQREVGATQKTVALLQPYLR